MVFYSQARTRGEEEERVCRRRDLLADSPRSLILSIVRCLNVTKVRGVHMHYIHVEICKQSMIYAYANLLRRYLSSETGAWRAKDL